MARDRVNVRLRQLLEERGFHFVDSAGPEKEPEEEDADGPAAGPRGAGGAAAGAEDLRAQRRWVADCRAWGAQARGDPTWRGQLIARRVR